MSMQQPVRPPRLLDGAPYSALVLAVVPPLFGSALFTLAFRTGTARGDGSAQMAMAGLAIAAGIAGLSVLGFASLAGAIAAGISPASGEPLRRMTLVGLAFQLLLLAGAVGVLGRGTL